MTNFFYSIATIGFVFGGVTWSTLGLISGNLVYVVLGVSSLCLGATFFVFSRGTTDS
ncbi:MAG: hypothetical protein V3W41_04965 [Planctomycetota bacterium]